MAGPNQWSFDGYDIPYADSPVRGSSGDWNEEEKLIEHDPLNANLTILTSWGFKSRRRSVQGTCGQLTRDTMLTKGRNRVTATLTDGEGRSISARIIRADFTTLLPVNPGARY